MQIGSHVLTNGLILAPMAGITDHPFRQLCKRLGAGMAISEMMSANALLWRSEKTQRRAYHEGEMGPHWVQIVGAEPQLMAQAAQYNVDQGAEIIDINMGCPAKKICNTFAGSALLQNEPLVIAILEAVVKAVSVPITLKIRTGWDKDHRNGVRIAQLAESIGIQAITVHGRTRACGFRGDAEYETIAQIKATVQIPVIANGDINSPEKARSVLDFTQADALMIGRAAQGNPWIFREINDYLNDGKKTARPTLAETYPILLEHLEHLYRFYGDYVGVRMARKHLAWYSKGQPHGAVFRCHINQAENPIDQLKLTKEFFGSF